MAEGPFEKQVRLVHETPIWVRDSEEVFFLTVCCEERGKDSLATPEQGPALLESVKFRNEQGVWWCSAFVVMPDHVHFLVNFPEGKVMQDSIEKWKRWTSRQLGIDWQRDWFDHRLRRDESWREKAEYIVNNPVRAGLVEEAGDWPYFLFAER